MTANYGLTGYTALDGTTATTASGTSDSLSNAVARGVMVFVNVTAASGSSPTLVVKLQAQDPASGTWFDITDVATASITGTGASLLTIYPGLTVAANSKIDMPVPRTFRVAWTLGGSSPSFTFSVGVQPLP